MTSVTDSAGFSTAIADVDLEALFTSISNHVALAGNNVSLEMLQLAAEVYGPDVESRSGHITQNLPRWWRPSKITLLLTLTAFNRS